VQPSQQWLIRGGLADLIGYAKALCDFRGVLSRRRFGLRTMPESQCKREIVLLRSLHSTGRFSRLEFLPCLD